MPYRVSMIEKNLSNFPFQTFFVSREISKCPLIEEIIEFGKKLDKLGILDGACSLSLGYGKRILINADGTNFSNIERYEIIEIVDYDPVKNIILAIGKQDPSTETPVHWIVQKARNDINAALMITNDNIVEQFCNDLPITKNKAPRGTIELAKEVLQTLRDSKNIIIKNEGVLFVGFNLKEIEDSLLKVRRC